MLLARGFKGSCLQSAQPGLLINVPTRCFFQTFPGSAWCRQRPAVAAKQLRLLSKRSLLAS